MADQPSPNQVNIDVPLSNLSLAYLQNQNNFIADKVFQRVRVQHKTGLFFSFPKEAFLRDDMKKRGPGTESEGSGWQLSTLPYKTDVYALHKDLDDQTLANAYQGIDLRMTTATWLTQQALQRQETQFVSDFFKSGVWGTDLTGVASGATTGQFVQWNDYTSSDPIGDIKTAQETLLTNTGIEGNTLVIGYHTLRMLENHPDFLDRIKYTQTGIVTEQLLASLFGVDRVLVAKAVKNTAEEPQSGVYSFHFGKGALLVYSNPNPGIMAPSAAYQFVWDGVSDGMGAEVGITKIQMPHLRSERMEIQMAWSNQVVGADLGVYFGSAVA